MAENLSGGINAVKDNILPVAFAASSAEGSVITSLEGAEKLFVTSSRISPYVSAYTPYLHQCEAQQIEPFPLHGVGNILMVPGHADAPYSVVGTGFDQDLVTRRHEEVPQLFILPELFQITPQDDIEPVLCPDLFVETGNGSTKRLCLVRAF